MSININDFRGHISGRQAPRQGIPLLQPCHGACISPCRAQASATLSTSSAPWTGMALAFLRTAIISPRTPKGGHSRPPTPVVSRGSRQSPVGCLSRPLHFPIPPCIPSWGKIPTRKASGNWPVCAILSASLYWLRLRPKRAPATRCMDTLRVHLSATFRS